MKNKILVFIVLLLALLAGFYYLTRPKDAIKENNQIVDSQAQKKLVMDDFEINLPDGWIQATPVTGTLAMAVNSNEKSDSGFKSYLAVSKDVLQDMDIGGYVETVKDALVGAIPNAVFENEQEAMINERNARAFEAEMNQQGEDYKVLIVAVEGEGNDVWVMSFNTIKSNWDAYKDTFSAVAGSFKLKK